MDLNQYKALESDKKLAIWERLAGNPDFQLLQNIFQKETRVLAKPTTQDGKEAFHYESIRAQAVLDVLMYPADQVREREKYKTAPAQDV